MIALVFNGPINKMNVHAPLLYVIQNPYNTKTVNHAFMNSMLYSIRLPSTHWAACRDIYTYIPIHVSDSCEQVKLHIDLIGNVSALV